MNMQDGDSDVPLPPEESLDGSPVDATAETQTKDSSEQLTHAHVHDSGETLVPADPFEIFDPPRSPEERGRFAGYRILGLLGAGGMGLVFEAEDPLLRRRVALKVLKPEKAGPVVRVRFLREAQTAASIKDDHIVTIYQVGEQGGRPYLVMELLKGESLEHRLKRERWLSVPESLRIARQIARGLRAAHSMGLVHRDIKPANIWLEESPDGESASRVKILDFGLAKAVLDKTELTQDGFIVGTPTYMAPEQLAGLGLDARTDLYALGVVLYRMIGGTPPFQSKSVPELMAAILSRDVPPVDSPRVPSAVQELLRDLLDKDPNKRPPDATAVLERIRSIEDHLPSSAGENVAAPAAGEMPLTPARRPIGMQAWIGAVAIIASIVIGLAVMWQKLNEATSETDPEVVSTAPKGLVTDLKAGKVPEASGERVSPAKAKLPTTPPTAFSGPPIKVGLLHSLTGALSAVERPMVEAENMAIEEINESGGLLGRPVEMVIGDGHSDEFAFANTARKLIDEEHVDVLIGCLSSASRKRVKAVCEEKDRLLFYPMMFEGLEMSPNIIYVGGGPNQQLLPLVRWTIGFFDPPRRRFFLLGSESVFSRAAQELFRGELAKHGLEPVGVKSVANGEVTGFEAVIDEIRGSRADIVLDTMELESDRIFFKTLGRLGIKAGELPVFSICLGEDLLRSLERRLITGHYSALNYFETVDTPENAQFLKRLRSKHATVPANASVESAYVSVMIWKQAVERAVSLESAKVRAAVSGMEFKAPEGIVRISENIFYGSRIARIGRMRDDGKFEILFSSPSPMQTIQYPPPHDESGWENFLTDLTKSWGGRWTGATASH